MLYYEKVKLDRMQRVVRRVDTKRMHMKDRKFINTQMNK